MPFKSEKIKLPQEYDRRRKLTDEQKDETIEQIGERLITFRNDNGESSVHFALTYKEAETAVIE